MNEKLTTEQVKAGYLHGLTGMAHGETSDTFDEWLEAVKEKAYDEGCTDAILPWGFPQGDL